MDEFCMQDFVCPGARAGPTEDLKVCFNLLVDTFHFSVGLGMIGSGQGEVIIEEFSELLGNGGGEL